MSPRYIETVVTAHRQREGARFIVRRPVPTNGLDQLDSFLLLDEVGPVDYAPGEALGAPDHPHRGFETVSYILSGEKLHENSIGKSQLIGPGDVQWMTAGAGIIHSELPGPDFLKSGGQAHGFQIWVNLPSKDKAAEPGYQYLPAKDIPTATATATDANRDVEVTIIAGEAFGTKASIGTHTPIWLQNWKIAPGAATEIDIPSSYNAVAYVFDGALNFGSPETLVERGQLANFGPGTTLTVSALSESMGGRFLLLAGEPLGEPVAWHGPFVMNTHKRKSPPRSTIIERAASAGSCANNCNQRAGCTAGIFSQRTRDKLSREGRFYSLRMSQWRSCSLRLGFSDVSPRRAAS
jgi:redox-sensitive bicupin YhaK (pirin superfamily)